MKTLIIAEAGVNHNGNLNLAKEMIEAAAAAGSNIVKFQSFDAQRLATQIASKATYQLDGSQENQYQMLKKLELTEQMHIELIAHCKKFDIEFLSTGFDTESLNMLIRLGISRIKIPSGELTNYPFLKHVATLKKEVILSTGMASYSDIKSAIEILCSSGLLKSQITVLHCTSSYPLNMEDVNLKAMPAIARDFQVSVGYSDHTLGLEVPLAAVALGATIIEKHFTMSRDLEGPDHKASLEPTELKGMVSAIRRVERALGNGEKKIMPSEIQNLTAVRKSIVAKKNIRKGELLSELNLTTKRPGLGLSPMKWPTIIGKLASRDYEADDFIDET